MCLGVEPRVDQYAQGDSGLQLPFFRGGDAAVLACVSLKERVRHSTGRAPKEGESSLYIKRHIGERSD